MQDISNREMVLGGARQVGAEYVELCVLSAPSFFKYKTVLKNKVY